MRKLGLEGEWRLRRLADGSDRGAIMPGDIVSALIASGEIGDPYWARNELDLQWIGREDWLLERVFELDGDFLAHPRVLLEMGSLDTVAEITINGVPLASQANMFRGFSAELRPHLKEGSNSLAVTIRSPEKAAEAAAAELPYPVPYSQYPVFSPHRNLIRKAQCMAGWDWGPCLMTGGIYGEISLTATDGPRIEWLSTGTRRSGPGSWKVQVEACIGTDQAGEVELVLSLAGSTLRRSYAAPAGSSLELFVLEAEGVEEWWPAGYGDQALYELVASCRSPGAISASHVVRKRIGFRELTVLAEEDAIGRGMVFKVNGIDVFCKGANWIPADALPSRWTRERIAGLLASAIEANMNCLRVWGGGRYESDEFYELCDELGIMVWQDCMFSCALYPSSPAFLAEVEAEIRHQVRRLKHHPCLALWCGNNEALGAITWYPESKASPARYIADYDRLTEGVLGRVIRELDPDRTWWPSSPSAGPNDWSDNWHSDARGDMHFWSVWHEGRSFSEYHSVRPRFCSEFGFQSYPSYRQSLAFCPPDERNVTSPAMEHHQRHPRGNSLILETMSRYFRMPRGFRETLYLSQVQQALAIKTAVEYWRSCRPVCMGTLYWQLNDVWPGSSWSSLEHDGSWKLLHYEARRFFESVIVALYMKDGSVFASGINDGSEPVEGELSLSFIGFDGASLGEHRFPARIPSRSASLLWEAPLPELGIAPEKAFLSARLAMRASAGALERRAELFLTEPKHCSLIDPGLAFVVEDSEDGPILDIKAAAPAFYVCPETSLPGRFEDSGFTMLSGENRRLRFIPARSQRGPGAAELRAELRVHSLRSSYE